MRLERVFGLVLASLRKDRGFSQEALGFEAGYHRTYISQLERGKKSPSLQTIFQIAAALKTSPSAMVKGVEVQVGKVSARSR